MVRPVSLTRPRMMRRKSKQINALTEAGAVYVGRTKGGTGLYRIREESQRIRPMFKAEQIEMGVENALHFEYGISKKKAKRSVGL